MLALVFSFSPEFHFVVVRVGTTTPLRLVLQKTLGSHYRIVLLRTSMLIIRLNDRWERQETGQVLSFHFPLILCVLVTPKSGTGGLIYQNNTPLFVGDQDGIPAGLKYIQGRDNGGRTRRHSCVLSKEKSKVKSLCDVATVLGVSIV